MYEFILRSKLPKYSLKMKISKINIIYRFNKIFSTSQVTPTTTTASSYCNAYKRNDVDSDHRLDNLSPFFMCFENKRWEWPFMKEPDLMLKYSILMSFIVFICIFTVQLLNYA